MMIAKSLTLLCAAGCAIAADSLPDPLGGTPAADSPTVTTAADSGALPDPTAAPTTDQQLSSWEIRGRLTAGYDSNVTLESDAIEIASDQESAFLALAASIQHRALLDNGMRASGQAFVEHHFYTDLDDLDLTQAGLFGSLVTGGEQLLYSGLAGYNYIAVDGESAAHAVNGSARASLIVADDYVWFGAADLIWIDYPDVEAASGIRLEPRIGMWAIFDPDVSRRRFEGEVRFSSYLADDDAESFVGGRTDIRWRYRWFRQEQPIDLVVAYGAEYRDYQEAGPLASSAEQRWLHRASITGDWAITPTYGLAVSLRGTISDSDLPANDYDRLIIGSSFTATW